MTTLEFPLNAQNGTLAMVSNDAAAQQLVRALSSTRPGELPLSRDYGIVVDYNVHFTTTSLMERQVVEAIKSWYPQLGIRTAEVRFDDEGRSAEISVDLELVEG